MLEKPEDVWSNVPENVGITYIYGAFQDQFTPHVNRIRFLQDWDHEELSVPALLNTRDRFFVIDDAYAGAGDRIRHLMVTLGHHQNFCIILLLHHLYSHSVKHLREINLNATAFLLSYSPASKSMMRTFASQYYGGGKDTRDFFDVFDHVMDGGKYSYLCVCFSPLIPNKYRLSSFLSASEGPTVYYVKK